MVAIVRHWIERRRQLRQRWKEDARALIAGDEHGAYYAAQRLAAKSRANGDAKGFLHWAKVAAEVARCSPLAEMNRSKVEQIVDEELERRT